LLLIQHMSSIYYHNLNNLSQTQVLNLDMLKYSCFCKDKENLYMKYKLM